MAAYHSPEVFSIDANNNEQSIFSFIRQGDKQEDALVDRMEFYESYIWKLKVGCTRFQLYDLNSWCTAIWTVRDKWIRKRLKTILEPHHNQAAHVEITIHHLAYPDTTSEDGEREQKNKMAPQKQKCVACY